MICHNYRRAPAVALAKQLITQGRIGKVNHYRGTYLQDWLVDPQFPHVWRLEKSKAGSGALGDLLSHSIDLARYLVGEIIEVSALLKTFIGERPGVEKATNTVEVDDAALSLVRFADGAIGSIEASRFATGRKNQNRFEINGSKGSVVFNLERMNELELYVDEGSESGFRTIQVTGKTHPYMEGWWPPGHIIGYEHTFTHTVLELLQALKEGRLPSPNFEDGVRNQAVMDAVERAAASRKWETVS
jgi:predicted dehydrogenase